MSHSLAEDDFIPDDSADDSADDGAIPAYDDLMFACTNLCELLDVENDALLNHDAETIAALGDRKVALTRLYASYTRGLAELPDSGRAFNPEQKEELLAIGQQLEELIERNAMLLRAAIEATKTVVDIIAHSVRSSQEPGIVYCRAGTMCANDDKSTSYSLNNIL
ncbi:flagellar protein FlgN [Magnetospirillum molischianum]|uniref:Flagellar protein FlgN n=1 Tax=Magnetospirillum molischianum DSM 120 TaxID=1150626 RepID=H8FQK6_MAGML|nr:flagellar protein FlgN [Magnetospirillum molischianum]CCG40644.1 conserved hypothetical protein [Magnetospirillum molischianum DSM 120]